MKRLFYIAFTFFTCFCSQLLLSQEKISATLSRNHIKIGETVELSIKTTSLPQATVVFPNEKNFRTFELIEQTAIDTLKTENQWEMVKKYTLIQFDSGVHTIDPLHVFIDKKAYKTPAYKVQVTDVSVDTTKQPMYDIKATIETEKEKSSSLGYWIAIGLAIILAILSYFIVKYIQGKNLTEEDHYRTPLEKLIKKLKNVDAKKQVINGDIKGYYSEITYLLRDYIEEVLEIPAKESTSTELIQNINQMIKKGALKLNKEIVKKLDVLLKTADLVKFAKVEPAFSQIENDRKTIDLLSIDIDKTVSTFEEEQRMRVYLRERRYKKRKQWRIFTPIVVASTVLLITAIVYINQIFAEGRQWSIFQSNRLLYKQEWVSSAYGYPTIIVATPQPMLRISNKAEQTADFLYKNQDTNLLVYVSTQEIETKQDETDNKQEIEPIIDQKIKTIANKLQFTFQKIDKTKVNDTTWKITILFSKTNENKSVDMIAEVFVFANNKGNQTLFVAYPQKDKYGKLIAEKIMNSVQLNGTLANE